MYLNTLFSESPFGKENQKVGWGLGGKNEYWLLTQVRPCSLTDDGVRVGVRSRHSQRGVQIRSRVCSTVQAHSLWHHKLKGKKPRIKFLIKCHLYLSASSETEYQILNQSMFACFTYYGNVKIRAKPYSFRKARSIDRKLENKKCMSTIVTTFYLTFSWKFYGTQLSQSNWRHKD